ncbi:MULTISPECIES: TetR/AcrR family transcriptional regulator [unclassified Nocardioides]|uniref:TetR/AcrR family transcriptional regulator n=1 Tax=unclassified Nocardioides TaxID=2615069 RepID=UPI00138EF5D3|nr:MULTISPECIES: TetR/AcrR family transcriptional regulator [unclassified Nocardioides]
MASDSYHHGNLRTSLLEAAVATVAERGPQALVLRDLARQVGVSHNAAYRHFADRDELVTEVAAIAMERLVATLHERLERVSTDDPVLRARQRLAEIGRGYVEFAVAETGLFRLAFASTATVATAGTSASRDPLALLATCLDELVAVGFLSPEARVDAEATCWSGVHGFSMLHIDGALSSADDAERDAALDGLLVAIDRSYGASTGTPTEPGDIVSTGKG